MPRAEIFEGIVKFIEEASKNLDERIPMTFN